jgi:hypothetical protein
MRPVDETAIPATSLENHLDIGRLESSICRPLIVEEIDYFERKAVDSRILRDLLS